MPRPLKPPRLYLRDRPGREPVFVIRDRGHEISTGCGPERQNDAEKAFAAYLADKHVPDWGSGDPALIPVADVLTLYITEVASGHRHPELVDYHAGPLLDFFGLNMCWDLTASACRAYVAARHLDPKEPEDADVALLRKYFRRPAATPEDLRVLSGFTQRRIVETSTARRELETLNAALAYAYRSRKINKPVPIDLPGKSPARTRWLTRSEAARLLAGALGFETLEIDGEGRMVKWRRVGPPVRHAARFIVSTLYNCTRHEASLSMRWGVNTAAGWYDLGNAVMYRRGQDEADSKKRRVPAPIPDRLMPHLLRWRRLTLAGPCEFSHASYARAGARKATDAPRFTAKLRTAWERARRLAKLDDAVTPHVLKHTSITWMLQAGVSIWEVAGFSGTSEKVIRDVYGHHAPDRLPAAKRAFQGRNRGGLT